MESSAEELALYVSNLKRMLATAQSALEGRDKRRRADASVSPQLQPTLQPTAISTHSTPRSVLAPLLQFTPPPPQLTPEQQVVQQRLSWLQTEVLQGQGPDPYQLEPVLQGQGYGAFFEAQTAQPKRK